MLSLSQMWSWANLERAIFWFNSLSLFIPSLILQKWLNPPALRPLSSSESLVLGLATFWRSYFQADVHSIVSQAYISMKVINLGPIVESFENL